jgi:acetyltransferase-like isoleucine patch superfamily enzyme
MSPDGRDALEKVRNMPWTASLEVRRRLAWPLVRAQFAWHGIEWGAGWKIFGRPILQRHRGSRIALGDGLYLRSWPDSNPLSPNHPVVLSTRRSSSVIEVGRDCGFTGSTIVAASRVQIGDRVQVGGNAHLIDFDFHPLDPEARQANFNAGAHAPIVVRDDVFIGMNSLILKGVELGEGCVVGAGSVVARDVPPGVVVAGNPAAVVREVGG